MKKEKPKKFEVLPPKFVNVLGMKTKVILLNNLARDGFIIDGLFSPDDQTIWVRKNQPCEMIWRAFFHELTHALTYRNGLNFTGLSSEVHEMLAETNATVMYEFMSQYFGEWHD